MNPKILVRISNSIGIIAIILLVYWVFSFTTIEVFGLKVFRENLSQTFMMSVFGILALMFGALIINIMFNLTRIAQRNQEEELNAKSRKKLVWLLLAIFPVLFILLFAGDYLTSEKKEKLLVGSAKALIEGSTAKSDHLIDYTFNKEWIIKTSDILQILSKTDTHFPRVSIVVRDSIENEAVLLAFNAYGNGSLRDTIAPVKKEFIRQSTKVERDYLHEVFDDNIQDYRYSANDGTYELFYPYSKGNKKIVLYFSEFQRYGKIGS